MQLSTNYSTAIVVSDSPVVTAAIAAFAKRLILTHSFFAYHCLRIKLMQLQGHPSGWFRLKKAFPLFKNRENLCVSQVHILVAPITFKVLLLEVGPLQGARSPFVHHGLVIIPLLDKNSVALR